ncbi:methyltransferase domain-containing protein [Lutibacter sp. HS1-25]|uniref:methyltransferase domain-containing protein n=1 Tax=Lutibacter sp. HS1-25 TaxID=2485000 RepID=UPI001012B120|nr:methyltransferase domain-containing protein [Lutibacter sp. HS1-25]RXP63284.1 methyltransferase domain-containing protein [Lutibacter sp. HS1-25]
MNNDLNDLIKNGVENLALKFEKINLNTLNISDYNKIYLQKYIDNYSFYMSMYSQLLTKAIKKLNKPISESIFIDYGGGSGMLTYLASEVGFKKIIYNDIYDVSVKDTEIISNALKIKIDNFICGDVEIFVEEINKLNIKPDLICSVDVLEHIYNLENWFENIATIDAGFSLLFMTSANSKNPFIVKRLKKLHLNAEFKGSSQTTGWKDRDLNTSFLSARKKIIKDNFPYLKDDEIELLSSKTRGLQVNEIINVVNHYHKFNEIKYKINHPTNTCDPYTGNWTENLIDLEYLKKMIESKNMNVCYTNSFYGYSKNKILNIPKTILNQTIKLLGNKNLFFSHTYTLEVKKNSLIIDK